LKTIMKSILEEFFSTGGDSSSGMFFLLRLFTLSPDIMQLLIDDISHFASTENCLHLIKLSSNPALGLSLPQAGISEFVLAVLRSLNPSALLVVLEALEPIAFEEIALGGLNLPANQVNNIRQLINVIIDQAVNSLLATIHCDATTKMETSPFQKYVDDEELKEASIRSVLRNDKKGQLKAKILHMTCIVGGANTSAEFLSKMFLYAEGKEQVSGMAK
jgi:hypothetical protein